MLNAGVSPRDISRFARLVSYETAFSICSHLDDPVLSYEGFEDEDDEQLAWGLFVADPEDEEAAPTPLTGLHESLLMMDPSGREMRPDDAQT